MTRKLIKIAQASLVCQVILISDAFGGLLRVEPDWPGLFSDLEWKDSSIKNSKEIVVNGDIVKFIFIGVSRGTNFDQALDCLYNLA